MFAPCEANFLAISRPIPREAPVTKATLFCNKVIIKGKLNYMFAYQNYGLIV
jgi:hypothetical protein